MITVYISIGNSDDKLTQARWSRYVRDMDRVIRQHAAEIHGEWHSPAAAPWQKACWCAVVDDTTTLPGYLTEAVSRTRARYGQESAAWAEVPVTQFI